MWTTRPLVALSHKFTSAIIFTDAPGSHWLCSMFFSKENWMLLLASVGLYQLLSRDKLVVVVFAGFVFSVSIPGPFHGQFCSALRGHGEVWSFPWLPSAQTLGLWRFSVLQNHLYVGEIHIHLCVDVLAEDGEFKEREKVCVCTQALNTHTESHKGPSGEPTLKVNAAPGCN